MSKFLLQLVDHKNIRRRVYDALNVLMAMNIIKKERKEITWIGLPTNSSQECQKIEASNNDKLPLKPIEASVYLVAHKMDH